jgi:predicted ATPase
LLDAGEADAVRQAHLDYYLELAEQADPHLRGPAQMAWLARLATEHDNLRAALGWSLARPDGAEVGIRLAGALQWFWFLRGPVAEGREWLERLLSKGAGVPAAVRAQALAGLGMLNWRLDNYTQARSALEEGLALSQALGDASAIAFVLHHLAHVTEILGSFHRAVGMFEESVSSFRTIGNAWGTAWSLTCMGNTLLQQGNLARAVPHLEESLALVRQTGDRWVLGHALTSVKMYAQLS